MTRMMVILSLLVSFSTVARVGIKGEYCGARGSFIGTIASDFVIPEYFPPEPF